MLAVIETGGKQYNVSTDQKIIVEKLAGNVGDKLKIEKVLLKKDKDNKSTLGNPYISGSYVDVEICKTFKDKKIIIFKKRRRKNSRRKNGHRQMKSLIKILSIN
ncbi:MAG: 50S ribosomal protein L21 [Rickettsiales bacterium]|jgi:large subunit ribosomal protein L21|nr:50S ribosomal protein L21 [Rickettsiales bacterium]|tara:strand:- start:1633 stop:1944 length:312 start_codon:yes stop_codon:yes gene_type:complete